MVTYDGTTYYNDGEPFDPASADENLKAAAFKANKAYHESTSQGITGTTPAGSNASTSYSGKGMKEIVGMNSSVFKIKSYISGDDVFLEGAVSDIQMNWGLDWNEEKVYGRLDPIPTYSGTSRNISFSMELIAPSLGAKSGISIAKENTQLLQIVATMCYPAYAGDVTNGYDSGVLKAPPLVGIQYDNVICGKDGGYLKAYMKSFSVAMQQRGLFEMGVNQTKFYKRMTVSFDFGILHDQNLGHRSNGKPFDEEYKYPFNIKVPKG
tara:strand:+ start:13649 stop:14446 length:798 start_codon:yes stop_codon:yes gene_type:complete